MAHPFGFLRLSRLLPIALLAPAAWLPTTTLLVVAAPSAQAQVEKFMLRRGSKVGAESEVKPTNCKTAADGTIRCDTKIENPPGITPAQPIYSPFKN